MAEVTQKTTTSSATPVQAPNAGANAKKTHGLSFKRFFTNPGVSPYDEIQWELRTAQIVGAKGEILFEQQDVEVPKDWSMTATNIVASKYLHGTAWARRSARAASANWSAALPIPSATGGSAGGYFRSAEDAAVFHDELVYLLLHQYAAFNSPVWFNVGCDRLEPNSDAANWHWNPQLGRVEFSATGYKTPQCSACFINSIQDTMESILTLAKTEGMLFKWGSGTGTNLSPIRGSMEKLSGGGTASGPLSFMKGFDAFAGVIKSGGKTRRAAKMVILNIDHPDIVEFIDCKAQGRGQGLGADGSRLRRLDAGFRSLLVDLLPERQQLHPRHRRLHECGFARWRFQHARGGRRSGDRHPQGARTAAQDCRSHLAVRRSRHAVRHHHQPLAHLEELGPHQRLEPVLRVHVH